MNQRDEQRVIQALQAFSGGLTVTEQDIITANNRLKDNLEPPSPRRRLAMAAIVAAAALLAGVFIFQAIDDDVENSSPPPAETRTPAEELKAQLQPDGYVMSGFMDGTPPTAEQLPGPWLLRPFGEEPAASFVDGDGDVFYGIPADQNADVTASFSGQELTRTWDEKGFCSDVGTQTFSTVVASDGSLHVQLMTGTNSCTPTDGHEVWDRVTPGSPVGDYMVAVAEDADWQAFSGQSTLPGVYVAPQTGEVLHISNDGSYRFFDALTADEIVSADQGELEWGTGVLSGSCTDGSFSGSLEAATIPAVEGLVFRAPAIRFTSDTNSCGSGIADGGPWVRLIQS